ncbi:hypothetical protein GpartN1_g7166.t1 [Galdieria partita]|uniref:PROP1-like PPR domain-containing protein n=1 Tax=Galdieria partita TaxID=83374 RepID=A0A9C7Q3W6_9RHOD|nr:hypothetical protein GpartN1_g7166.t1 [Galdieria partita]
MTFTQVSIAAFAYGNHTVTSRRIKWGHKVSFPRRWFVQRKPSLCWRLSVFRVQNTAAVLSSSSSLSEREDETTPCNLPNLVTEHPTESHSPAEVTLRKLEEKASQVSVGVKVSNKSQYAESDTKLPPPGVSPTSWYNTRIRECVGRRDIKTILGILEKMRSTEGVVLNAVTFATSLSCCSKLRDMESAKIIWKMYEEEKIPPSSYVFSSMIAVCARAQPAHVDLALKLFHTLLETGIQPNKIVYNATIDICSRTMRYREALELFENFHMSGDSPDAYTYNAILRIFASQGDIEGTRKMFQEMLSAHISPSVITFSIVMEAFGRLRRLDHVLEFFHKMQHQGVEPNAVTYNILISACAHSREYNKALGFAAEMSTKGLLKDRYTYNGLMHASVAAKQYEATLEWYDSMLENHVVPNNVTFRYLFEAGGGLERFEVVELGLKHMERMGLSLNVYTFAALVAACIHCKKFEAGQNYQKQAQYLLKRQGKIFYEQLANILQSFGDTVRAHKIFSKLQRYQQS